MLDDKIERDKLIKKWLTEASALIKKHMENTIKIEEKTNPQDLVTNVDKAVERFLVNKIHEAFPGEEIISEEGYGDDLQSLNGVVWFIDPIDGTTNFITQQENFAIMIAVYMNGEGILGYVYDVMKDNLYSGIKGKGAFLNEKRMDTVGNVPLEKGVFASSTHLMTKDKYKVIRDLADDTLGVRMLGSAGLEICQVSSGKAVAYAASTLSPWDIAPGKIIAEEVGVVCSTLEGGNLDLLTSNQTLFANPTAHRQILDKLSLEAL